MAKDDFDFDMDWDNDPFSGDIDFDMNFDMDPFAGKGFVSGMTSGFLSGLVTETVGSGSARMRTLRTVLPSTFGNALDKLDFVKDRISKLAEEFKQENSSTVKSLQTIATHLNQKMGSKLPGFASDGLTSFSSKDFSSWEKLDSTNTAFKDRVESTTEDEVAQAIDNTVMAQSAMFNSLGESLNSMSAAIGAQLQSTIGAGNRQLINIESSIRDIANYHRNYQAKMDQAKINLMARSYVQDAKFYKFTEAGLHAVVKELKKTVENTGLSDFEKTSAYTASKNYVRNELFKTVGKRVGGLTGLANDRFGKSSRKGTYGAIGRVVGDIADGLDMSDGIPMSKGMIGSVIGKMVASVAVEELPIFFTRGPGKRVVDKLIKTYPTEAKYIKEQIKQITDIGNVVSYAATSGAGIINHMAENYQPIDEMKYSDYDDYRSSLPPGRKALPKSVWVAVNSGTNKAKESVNKLMSQVTKAKETQYTLGRRNVKDFNQPGVWKEMNNITLNEVIPGLLSRTNQILEKIRTGSDDAEAVNYNYMRGEFQKDSTRKVAVATDLMPHADFQLYASAALSLVDSVDPDKLLSAGARKALAKQVAKDIDGEKGFNPYYYLGDINGISSSHTKEIHATMKRYFGIKNSDVDDFKSSNSLGKMKKMSYMGDEQSRERLNKVSATAANIKENFPNVAERIDLLRQTGNEQMLRDLGVIYTEGGIDKINMQAFHDRIGMYMDDPDNPKLKGDIGKSKGAGKPGSVGKGFPLPKPSNGGGSGNVISPDHYEDLNNNLSTLNERLASGGSGNVNFDTGTGELTTIKDSNQGILDKTTEMALMLGSLLDLAKSGKLLAGAPKNKTEEREEETAKKSLIDKMKGLVPKDLLGKGSDFLMKNNPLILGGLLGGLGSQFVQNPLVAASVVGLGVMAGAYFQNKGRSSGGDGKEPSDDEDILDERGEPVLKAAILKAGGYIDATTRKVIKSWKDVRGPVIETSTKAVIGARDLAGKIFGPDGQAVALSGLRKVRDAAVGAYNSIDPLGRIKSVIEAGKNMLYQQDVYLKNNTSEPVLRAIKFKSGAYYCRDASGNFTPISGWNEINGAVYDDEGNQLVSEEEYESGLVTSTGAAIRNVGGIAASMAGGAAGLARSGLDKVLGRFGFSSNNNRPVGGGAKGSGSPSGVERRLDKIYRMLSQHFNIPMEADEGVIGAVTGGTVGDGLRLNSLAFKAREAEKDEKKKVNKAIIKISESMGGEDDDKGKKKEGGGLWDKMKGLITGLGGFAMNLIKNPLGTIGGMVMGSLGSSMGRLAKIGSALFSGVLGLASPIYSLLKTGFTKLASAFLGGRAIAGGIDQFGQSGRRGKGGKGGATKPKRGGRKMGRGLGGLVAGTALSYGAAQMLGGDESEDNEGGWMSPTEGSEVAVGERDPVTGHYRTRGDQIVETLTDWLPQGQLAKALVEGSADKESKDKWSNYGMFWTSDGEFFMKRDEAEAREDQIKGVVKSKDGYGEVQKPKMTTQRGIRFGMYGIVEQDSPLGRRVGLLESLLYPYITIRNDRAALKPDTPTDKILQQFINAAGNDTKDNDAVMTWYIARFKPVFLIFNAAVSVARMGDINEFDNSKSYDVVRVVERVQEAVATLDPYPYNIDVRIDSKVALMNDILTKRWVNVLLEKLKKEIPSPVVSVEKIATTAQKDIKTATGASDPNTPPTPDQTAQNKLGEAAARGSMADIEKRFSQPGEVKSIDISDEMPGGDKEMDPFVMARLAAYGNIDNMSWRVESVLRLERYVESFIMVMGNDARFTGKSTQLLELFKPSFRIADKNAEMNWLTWFRDRFLPVVMTYVKEVKKLRGVGPERGWKQLTATNRAVIARKLTEQMVTVGDKQTTVWEVEASPFPNSKSGKWSDRADKYLKMLDDKAQQARLKDPEMETEKSEGIKGDDPAQLGQAAKVRQNTQKALDEVYGNKSGGSGGGNQSAGGMSFGAQGGGVGSSGGVYPNATMSLPGGGAGSAGQFTGVADNNFNPEFLKMAGDDKGIKMSPEQGEKLMLNHLIKAGIKDNKVLALALAMAKKETGNYSATVENTNWSAPTLLKYFKNIPDAATAQKVAAMSPPERAMWVYGRSPKGPSLGNTKPEDGWNYRGRGLFQLTGKANYERFKKDTGIDVVSNPKLVSEDPNVMAESAVRFLKNSKAMLAIEKTGDFETAVRGINGGNAVPATDERRKYYNDYLNRLRSGDLNLGGNDGGAAAAETPPATETPAAADKNAPVDKIAGDPSVGTPTSQSSVTDLLKESEQRAAPSNVGPTTSTPATASDNSASPQAPSVPATAPPANVSSGTSETVNASVAATVPTSAPVTPVTPKVPAPVPQAPKVEMPKSMATTDVTLAKLLIQSNQTLTEISKKLDKSSAPGGFVKMN